MSLLHISLFGKFHVCSGQQALAGFDTPRVQELFCYLLLYRDRPHAREILADLLWHDSHTDQPSRCLRKTLCQLRAALDSQAERLGDCVLLVDPDWIQINPEADLWLDVAVFEEAFHRVQSRHGHELDSQSVQTLQSAVGLYRGGLQESWYQDWYLYERERFQHIYLILLDKLMDYCEAHQDYEAGLAYGTHILHCERTRERTHRRLMRLYYLAGDRTAALRQYALCVRALEEELGVRPAKRTVTLCQRIQADQLGQSMLAPVGPDWAPQMAASPLSTVVARLRQLQATLVDVQRGISQDIQAMELTMNSQDPPPHPPLGMPR